MSLTTVKQVGDSITVVKDIAEDIADRVASLRGKMGQAEFAKLAGLSPGAIGNIEARTRSGSATTLAKIAKACGVRIEWLLDGSEPKHAVGSGASDGATLRSTESQTLSAALEALGIALAKDMTPDVRADLGDAFKKLVERRGNYRDQRFVLALLSEPPGKQRRTAGS
jgi:transcriptional regulator with XRE-family HTH domain